MSSRSNFIFGPFADSAWKQPKIASHADPAVARHLFAKTPQRTTRALCVAAMRELRPISLDACLRVPTTSRAGARASLLPPSLPLPVPRLALALSRGKRSRHGRCHEAQATAAIPAAPSHRGRSRVCYHLRLASPSPSRALVAAEFHRRAAAGTGDSGGVAFRRSARRGRR